MIHQLIGLGTFLIKESSEDKNDIFTKIIERIKSKHKYNDLMILLKIF